MPQTTKNSQTSGGLRRLLPQLPTQGFSVKVPKGQKHYNALKSHKSMRASANNRTLQVDHSLVNTAEKEDYATSQVENESGIQEEREENSIDMSGRNSK